MEINKDKLKRFMELSDNKAITKETLDENLKTVKAQFEDEDIERIVDGKKVTCKQKDLWMELYEMGINKEKPSQAEEILRGLYPDTFQLVDKDIKLAKEFNAFSFKNFGIMPSQMSLSAIVNLVIKLIDYKLEEKND